MAILSDKLHDAIVALIDKVYQADTQVLLQVLSSGNQRIEFANKLLIDLSGFEFKALLERLADAQSIDVCIEWSDEYELALDASRSLLCFLVEHYLLDEQVFRALQPLLLVLFGHFVSGNKGFFTQQNVYCESLQLILQNVRGIDGYSGERAKEVISASTRFISALCQGMNNSIQYVMKEKQAYIDAISVYHLRLKKFEDKLFQQERVLAKSAQIRHQVTHFVELKMHNNPLPTQVVEFLRDTWAKYLYITYLRSGKSSVEWKEGCQLVDELIWSLTVEDGQELLEAYGTRISAMMRQIRDALESMHHNSNISELFLQALEQWHLQLMQGESLPSRQYQYVAENDEQVKNSEFKRYKPGDWVLLMEHEKAIKGKVAGRDNNLGFMLIVNYSGVKIGKKYARDFDLEHVKIRKLDAQAMFINVLFDYAKYLDVAVNRIKQLQKSNLEPTSGVSRVLKTHQNISEKKGDEKRFSVFVGNTEFQCDRVSSEEKMLAVWRDVVNKLKVGALIVLSLENGEMFECRLGLVLENSSRLILLDNVGNRVASVSKIELMNLLECRVAFIKSTGYQWDQSIKSAVLESRKALNKE